MKTVKATDLKEKGIRLRLRNGTEAETADRIANRYYRFCKVYGMFTEFGSVYTAEIALAFVDGEWHQVEHSQKAKDAYMAAKRLFGV